MNMRDIDTRTTRLQTMHDTSPAVPRGVLGKAMKHIAFSAVALFGAVCAPVAAFAANESPVDHVAVTEDQATEADDTAEYDTVATEIAPQVAHGSAPDPLRMMQVAAQLSDISYSNAGVDMRAHFHMTTPDQIERLAQAETQPAETQSAESAPAAPTQIADVTASNVPPASADATDIDAPQSSDNRSPISDALEKSSFTLPDKTLPKAEPKAAPAVPEPAKSEQAPPAEAGGDANANNAGDFKTLQPVLQKSESEALPALPQTRASTQTLPKLTRVTGDKMDTSAIVSYGKLTTTDVTPNAIPVTAAPEKAHASVPIADGHETSTRDFPVSIAEWEALHFSDVSEIEDNRIFEATHGGKRYRVSIAHALGLQSNWHAVVDRLCPNGTGLPVWSRVDLMSADRYNSTSSGALRAAIHAMNTAS